MIASWLSERARRGIGARLVRAPITDQRAVHLPSAGVTLIEVTIFWPPIIS
jgi:hypothetical protein